MLKNVDFTKTVKRSGYKETIGGLMLKISEQQRILRELKIPVTIIFEGWDAAEKGTLMNEMLMALDPRGFNVILAKAPDEEEKLRPFIQRFWLNTPEKGRIAIYNKSYYWQIIEGKIEKNITKKEYEYLVDEVKAFEKQLTDDKNVIVKFFMHIDKKEQKRRFKELESNKATAWRVTHKDWENHDKYDKYYEKICETLEKTNFDFSKWNIIASHDFEYAALKIFETLIAAFEGVINKNKADKMVLQAAEEKTALKILPEIDLGLSMTKEEYAAKIDEYEERIRELEYKIYKKRIPVIIAYEGWDAGGKGGNIKRVVQNLDPRGYEVVPIAAPNEEERNHHYLWRFWKKFPKAGHMAIFDRTWYGRVLVERVEGFCRGDEWKRAFEEINRMEKSLADSGAIIIKFWMHISKGEQLRRFEERKNTPYKNWKITEEDWRNREKWELYEKAVDEMLQKTTTDYAPWTVIEADSKYYARIKALKTVIEEIEKKLEEK